MKREINLIVVDLYMFTEYSFHVYNVIIFAVV
jgi:hypothetical protein